MELKKFYKGKRVFVTGHTGFKGSWLICLLSELGAKICGYALKPATEPNMFDLIKGQDFIEHNIGDINDYNNLLCVMQKFKPQIVLHLAAQPIVLSGYNNPRYTFQTNVIGTVNVLEAIRHCPSVKSVVNVTTDKVYQNNDNGRAFIETDQLCGYDPYSNSKSCSELVTYSYNKSFFKGKPAVSTARAGNVIGGGDWGDYRLVPDIVRGILSGKEIIIRNPFSTRPFQHVLEPLILYLQIAMKQYDNPEYSDSYNIGPDIENCVNVQSIMDAFKKYKPAVKFTIKQDPNARHEASRLELDNTKIKQALSYKITYNIDQTIKTISDWINAYTEKKDMKTFTCTQINNFLKGMS